MKADEGKKVKNVTEKKEQVRDVDRREGRGALGKKCRGGVMEWLADGEKIGNVNWVRSKNKFEKKRVYYSVKLSFL